MIPNSVKFIATLAIASIVCGNVQAQENTNVDENAITRVQTKIDLTKDIEKTDPPSVPATESKESQTAQQNIIDVPAPAPKFLPPDPNRAFLFEAFPKDFSDSSYTESVEKLISAYEKNTGRKLIPAEKKKVALKIYTNSGRGFATPKGLTRAVRNALEKRGFSRENILIVDLSKRNLRQTGYLPPFGNDKNSFWEKSPVIALDTGKHYNQKWFYENNLPPPETSIATTEEELQDERKSFLPIPLLFDVDFWINLPVASDNTAIGVSGALANATIWNISNQKRFLSNPANAALATVSIATIPEFKAKFELTILSLEKYQFIGGPKFDENYTLSEKQIWLSANPVIIDYLMWERMNVARQKNRFDLILPEPPVFSMASKGTVSLGSCISSEIKLVKVSDEKN